jgi:hypothetical protein
MRSWSARCSILLWCAAFLAMVNLVGCSGPRWPQTNAHINSNFLRSAGSVYTIDVLPPDVQVWTHQGSKVPAEDVAAQLDAVTRSAVAMDLARRGYAVRAQLEWDGTVVTPDGTAHEAMPGDHLNVTAYSLSGYGHAVEQARQGLLVPYLPHRLGVSTGSDATLYVGGWAYVGKPPTSKGAKIAQGIVIALFAVVIIAIVLVVLDKGGKGFGKAAGSAGNAAAKAGRAVTRVALTAGRTIAPVLRAPARFGPDIVRSMFDVADAFGHVHTHVYIYNGRPSYYEDQHTPKKGRSKMLLEMTLVDNRTGLVLWHTRETFPVHAPDVRQVRRAYTSLLSTLPAH